MGQSPGPCLGHTFSKVPRAWGPGMAGGGASTSVSWRACPGPLSEAQHFHSPSECSPLEHLVNLGKGAPLCVLREAEIREIVSNLKAVVLVSSW